MNKIIEIIRRFKYEEIKSLLLQQKRASPYFIWVCSFLICCTPNFILNYFKIFLISDKVKYFLDKSMLNSFSKSLITSLVNVCRYISCSILLLV